jgi:putative transcriptional regulator
MDYLTGSLLIASPKLPDPNFFRSVVFMVEHSDQGALGLILNRESNTTLRRVWENLVESVCRTDRHLHMGGPVTGPLMALHCDPDLEGVEVIPDVYFSSEKSTLEALVAQRERPFRVFSGYAGWGAGQLDGELQAGGWLTLPAERDHVFVDHADLWQEVTHAIGAEITDRALRIRHAPDDPRAN